MSSYTLHIKRQVSADSPSYWQDFSYDGTEDTSVVVALNELNWRAPLLDVDGATVEPIAFECGCLVRKCGACALRINGIPRLACNTFFRDLQGTTIVLEPLSKFPLVRDLIVDRATLFESLKKLELFLADKAHMSDWTHEPRYQSARCLMCGCCLEVCPNFLPNSDFAGAVAPVSGYRLFDQTRHGDHRSNLAAHYRTHYFEGCGHSLACHNICPLGLPVEELIVRSNAAALWGR